MNRRTLREIRRLWSRREALQGLGAMGVTAVACKTDAEDAAGTEGPATTSGDETTSSSSSSSADTSSESSSDGSESSSTGEVGPPQSDCEATGTATFEELFGPIEHIVVLMMENRSFDQIFGSLSLLEGRAVDGLTGKESNPDPDGNPVVVYNLGAANIEGDPSHSWNSSRAQWNEGANDGFVQNYADTEGPADPGVVMGYYDRARLPVSYTLADNYALCDRWFCSVMGPTWPNRFHLNLGTSHGIMSNDAITEVPSIFDRLDDAGITNRYFNAGLPFAFSYGKTEGFGTMNEFFEAAAAGTLPAFCMVDPIFTIGENIGNDDHPPCDPMLGQAFIATVYEALAQSPAWNNTLLVLTYDEHGGMYDHVSPPETEDERPEFRQLGFRVPSIVIGARVRRGCVVSTTYDHVSVVSTVTRKWNLESLSSRVDATVDLADCMDPAFIDDPQPPVALPTMSVRRPPEVAEGAKLPGQRELLEVAEKHGWDRARRVAHANASIDAIYEWGRKLGVLRVED
jgi:phospholipase C